jgi:hypothetical protein
VLLLALFACTSSPWRGELDVSGQLEVVLDASDGLNRPQDLDFNPERPGELWVVNRNDDSVTIVTDAPEDSRSSEHIIDPYALHFMERVSSIAFGAPGTFGTCQDSRNTYNGNAAPDNFMGPALWSHDMEVFGKSNPDAVAYLSSKSGMPTDLGSHLDMLHESPLCVGIAWDQLNVYWVFDGAHDAIVRYDFREDHGPGFDDHSDGIITRYIEGEVARVNGAVAHLELDPDADELLIADAGNGRVLALDTTSGRVGEQLRSRELGVDHHTKDDAAFEVLIDGLVQPGGIVLIDDHVVVTDVGTGEVLIFTRAGKQIATLDTGRGPDALAGLTGLSLDDLWVVDADADEVLRLRP